MTKSKRFKPIGKLADSKEQHKAQILSKSKQALSDSEQRLNELKIYRAEYVESYTTAGQQGMSVVNVRNYRLFLDNLDKAITQQEATVAELSQLMNQDKSQWLASLSRKKIMDKVIGKFKQQELKDDARKEQREIDDRAPVKK